MKKKISILVISLIILSMPVLVYANGAPSKLSPEPYGVIVPYHESNINILEENLYFKNINNKGAYSSMFMDVCVEYKIINTSENAMNVKIAFPCDEVSIRGYAKKLAITQDNMVIDYTYTSEIDYYEVFNVDREKFHHFLYNDKKVDFYDGYKNPVLILFDISLESNKTSTLKLEYEQYSGFDRNTQFFTYYLQPAKYWNDFKNLSIYIELPENYSFYSNFNFEIKEPNKFNKLYYTHFNELPEDDFYFITERTHTSKKVIISLVIAAVAVIALIIAGMKSSKKHKQISFRD